MKRESRELWKKRVERWKESGLSAGEYAAEIGVKEGTLRHWSWKFSAESRGVETLKRPTRNKKKSKSASISFVEVPTSESEAFFEVVLSSKLTIRVPMGFDDASLSRLISVLEAQT